MGPLLCLMGENCGMKYVFLGAKKLERKADIFLRGGGKSSGQHFYLGERYKNGKGGFFFGGGWIFPLLRGEGRGQNKFFCLLIIIDFITVMFFHQQCSGPTGSLPTLRRSPPPPFPPPPPFFPPQPFSVSSFEAFLHCQYISRTINHPHRL